MAASASERRQTARKDRSLADVEVIFATWGTPDLADTSIEEFHKWRDGEPLRYAVTREMLDTMA